MALKLVALIFLFFTISQAQYDPVKTDVNSNTKTTSDTPETVSFEIHVEKNDDIPLPLTFVSFRPINRHFPRGPLPLTFRRGGGVRCRHWGQRRLRPYGNDMILSSGDDANQAGFDSPQILRRFDSEDEIHWPRHHHHHLHHRHRHDDIEEFDRHDDHHRDHDHHHHHGDHDHENVLLKSFRKFLGQF